MTDFILGKIDCGEVLNAMKQNTFRPSFQHCYNVKHRPTYTFVNCYDENGNIIIKRFDVIKGVFVDN